MKLFASIAVIANKVKEDYVSAFAAQAALFVIMSFVPFLILLLTLIKYTPLTEEVLLQFVTNFAPDAFRQSFSSIISQLYTGSDTPLFLISLASILWTAGKGCNALIEGLNSVFDIKERRNGFVLRLYSILYTIIFVVIIVVCLLIYILGNEILSFITKHVPFVTNIIEALLNIRVLLSVGLFTVFFTFLYVAIPSRHTKIRRQLPGALFSAIGWTGFSYFFSLYVNYSHNIAVLYGSLAMVVCAMLWLYVCMFIFLLGAEINLYIEQWTMGRSVDKATDITHSRKRS
jgi:membrane protein